jgi:gas vesicle protein
MKSTLIFLLGVGVGTVLGVLIAPEPGKVTIKKIIDEADKMVDKAVLKKKSKVAVEKLEVEMASSPERIIY